ncbi:hypothetical protein HZA85_01275 [Candidatus Uhrbacteria bacterium]|nr:hypothetical protein [Candidatus Uhrbacteria bacterium]
MFSFLDLSLFLFIIWIAFLLFSRSTRKEQIFMSFVGIVLTPAILLMATGDYQNMMVSSTASIGLEDFLFAFSLFGIAAIIYQVVLGKHLHRIKGERLRHAHPAAHWYIHLVIVLGLWVFASLVLIDVLELVPLQALIVSGLLIGMYVIADRHDLLLDGLISGLLTVVLVLIVEEVIFLRLFASGGIGLQTVSKMIMPFAGGLPAQMIIWTALVGFTIGPLYEWLRHYELK